MTDWIVWYYDGTSFSSDDGPPESAPRDGVQIVAVKNATYGRIILCRYQGYCWHDNQWIAHGYDGIEQYKKFFPDGIVLRAFEIGDLEFFNLYNKALADADQRLPASTTLPAPDSPLPTRFRAYCFDDANFTDFEKS